MLPLLKPRAGAALGNTGLLVLAFLTIGRFHRTI
jgi:hypothetical protein